VNFAEDGFESYVKEIGL